MKSLFLVLHSQGQGREGKERKGAKTVLGLGAEEIRGVNSIIPLCLCTVEVYFLKHKYRALLFKGSVKKRVVEIVGKKVEKG